MSSLRNSLVGITAAVVVVNVTAVCAADEVTARSTNTAASSATSFIERGRYLVEIAGCNDCHTLGYAQSGGQVPESTWLTGDSLGWRGAWGTTYPRNLRLYMQTISEDQWLKIAHTAQFRPPMP